MSGGTAMFPFLLSPRGILTAGAFISAGAVGQMDWQRAPGNPACTGLPAWGMLLGLLAGIIYLFLFLPLCARLCNLPVQSLALRLWFSHLPWYALWLYPLQLRAPVIGWLNPWLFAGVTLLSMVLWLRAIGPALPWRLMGRRIVGAVHRARSLLLQHWAWGLCLLLLALGAFFRLSADIQRPLWLDEAWRANIASHPQWLHALRDNIHAPTALGYTWLLAQLACLHNVEWVLRLSALIPGIAALVLLYLLGRTLIGFRSALFLLYLAAVHSVWIRFAREVKPYSLELCLHVALLFFLALYAKKGKGLWAWLLLFAVGPLLSPAMVLLLPAQAVAMLLAGKRTKDVVLLCLACLAAGSLFLAQYLAFWQKLGAAQAGHPFWSACFFTSDAPLYRYPAWLFSRLGDISVWSILPGITERSLLFRLVGPACLLLVVAGLPTVRKKRWLVCALAGPVCTAAAVNAAGFWPLGAVRVNLLLQPLFMLAVVLCLDYLAMRKGFAGATALMLALLLVWQALPLPLHKASKSAPQVEDMRGALRYIDDMSWPARQAKPLIFVNKSAGPAFTYYTRYHLVYKQIWHGNLTKRFYWSVPLFFALDYQKREAARFLDQGRPVVLLLCHYDKQLFDTLMGLAHTRQRAWERTYFTQAVVVRVFPP